MNLTESIAPKADQINADDMLPGPRTVTVVEVKKGSLEQPVNVVTHEFGPGRPYKPSKSMRRILVTAWGVDSAAYAGRQITLFRNPTIRFGSEEVGGLQISHLSHLEKPLTVALTVSRGKRSPFTVQPLTAPPKPEDESGRDWLAELNLAGDDLAAVNALGAAAVAAHASDQTMALLRGVRDRLMQATS